MMPGTTLRKKRPMWDLKEDMTNESRDLRP